MLRGGGAGVAPGGVSARRTSNAWEIGLLIAPAPILADASCMLDDRAVPQ